MGNETGKINRTAIRRFTDVERRSTYPLRPDKLMQALRIGNELEAKTCLFGTKVAGRHHLSVCLWSDPEPVEPNTPVIISAGLRPPSAHVPDYWSVNVDQISLNPTSGELTGLGNRHYRYQYQLIAHDGRAIFHFPNPALSMQLTVNDPKVFSAFFDQHTMPATTHQVGLYWTKPSQDDQPRLTDAIAWCARTYTRGRADQPEGIMIDPSKLEKLAGKLNVPFVVDGDATVNRLLFGGGWQSEEDLKSTVLVQATP